MMTSRTRCASTYEQIGNETVFRGVPLGPPLFGAFRRRFSWQGPAKSSEAGHQGDFMGMLIHDDRRIRVRRLGKRTINSVTFGLNPGPRSSMAQAHDLMKSALSSKQPPKLLHCYTPWSGGRIQRMAAAIATTKPSTTTGL